LELHGIFHGRRQVAWSGVSYGPALHRSAGFSQTGLWNESSPFTAAHDGQNEIACSPITDGRYEVSKRLKRMPLWVRERLSRFVCSRRFGDQWIEERPARTQVRAQIGAHAPRPLHDLRRPDRQARPSGVACPKCDRIGRYSVRQLALQHIRRGCFVSEPHKHH
jgi:hypothetical protein